MSKNDLYPEIEPYETGMLKVDDLHTLYWEQCGNPNGQPVVFLHGGPGAGSSPSSRRFFDPEFYRIIVFDQRGANRSTPRGEMRQNTTPLLIEDIEQLRRHLAIEKWLVFGGSWGSTLALAYAQAHPSNVVGLVLRGIFLCRPKEIDWFFNHTKNIFPKIWEEFANYIPPEERHDLLGAYRRRVMHDDPAIYEPAVKAYCRYEGSIATFYPEPETVSGFEDLSVALGMARAEIHYFTHNIFLKDNQIMEDMYKIQDIPGVIVQGCYDIVTPPLTAYEVSKAWPSAKLVMVNDAGHSAFDAGIVKELIKATDLFRNEIKAKKIPFNYK